MEDYLKTVAYDWQVHEIEDRLEAEEIEEVEDTLEISDTAAVDIQSLIEETCNTELSYAQEEE
jgi:hypothetical protein